MISPAFFLFSLVFVFSLALALAFSPFPRDLPPGNMAPRRKRLKLGSAIPIPPLATLRTFPFRRPKPRAPPGPEDRAMNVSVKGNEALERKEFPLAIQHFTLALSEMPRAPAYYIARSIAYSRLSSADNGPKYQAALDDATVAVTLAYERGNRELLLAAQFRRAISMFLLGRLGDALFLFQCMEDKTKGFKKEPEAARPSLDTLAQSLSPAKDSSKPGYLTNYHSQLPSWMAKMRGMESKKQDEDLDKWAVNTEEIPIDVKVPDAESLRSQLDLMKVEIGESGEANLAVATPPSSFPSVKSEDSSMDTSLNSAGSKAPAQAVPVPREALRHTWYQSQDNVFVDIYVKGLSENDVNVKFERNSLNVQITFQSGVRDSVIIDPLWDTINLTSCSYNVKSTKISLTMRKAITITWKDLKGSFPTGITSDRSPQISYPPASRSALPSYPTSSRTGAKDWDKITSDLTEKTADSGKEDKGQESEDEDDQGVDGFFKKLYAKADPETQRAMIKSFTESQGTSLSTNWSQVSQGKVERHE